MLIYRKRQKLCGTSSDESIEKFNDVTAVSGINLRVCFLVATLFILNLDIEKRLTKLLSESVLGRGKTIIRFWS